MNKSHNSNEIKKENKPWTYWWWMGSAVDEKNITYNLEQFAEAGIGGVHIIPIYGVKGCENDFINYLSPKWMEMLAYTSEECERLNLGLDMTLGTGWPFGGSHVPDSLASSRMLDLITDVEGGRKVQIDIIGELDKSSTEKSIIRNKKIITADAFDVVGNRISLKDNIDSSGTITWEVPKGKWKIFALVQEGPVQSVKRAAPGAKGNVLDPFSEDALNDYLKHFDMAFSDYSGKMPRSFYHDSYEYYNADWTTNFLKEFKSRRGYNLLDFLPQFLTEEKSDITARIKSDYRYTIAELHTDFIEKTRVWSNSQNGLFRNQAHGSPTNIIDTYAAADIPECEIFGAPKLDIPGLVRDSVFMREEFVDPLILKFSSSAAHLAGRKYVSSETGTWLADHFRVSLSQIKPEIDLLFFSGVNHIFYHGIAYSPKDEEWPGWQFYAATSYAPTNSIWYDIPSLNEYIARCQSVLQSGKSDNEILLYFPIWDLWHNSEGRLIPLQVHQPEDWFFDTPLYQTAQKLFNNGYSFDYISDNQLNGLTVNNGDILSSDNRYKVVVVPKCKFIPVTTLNKLESIVKKGGKVIFLDSLPQDVPGYHEFENRRLVLESVKDKLLDKKNLESGILQIGSEVLALVENMGIPRERLSDHNIDFTRRKTDYGRSLFVVNQKSKSLDNWVELAYTGKVVQIIDPLTGKNGFAKTKTNSDGLLSVYLQIESGASLILKIFDDLIDLPEWNYIQKKQGGFEITGFWKVEFIQGGPTLPKTSSTEKLVSWTKFGDKESQRFAGTAKYSIKFQNPDTSCHNWILDLGVVRESARVKLNGKQIGVLWSIPFKTSFSGIIIKGENILEIKITNLSANRIRDLDIRNVEWKKFHDINFVNIHYKKFDASVWELTDSGLLGPVILYPAEQNYFEEN